ncbi:MAG: NADH-quinone oxidoreductase subunit B family protein [Candidatus Aquicultorales bacterium]
MQITRRQFVQYVAGAAAAMGVSQTAILKLTEQLAAGAWAKPSVIFLEAQVCGGCETSLLQLRHNSHSILGLVGIPNTLGTASVAGLPAGAAEDNAMPVLYPGIGGGSAVTIDDILLDVLDVKIIRIAGNPGGNLYVDTLKTYLPASMGGTDTNFGVLVVTGSIPLGATDSRKIGENACVSAAEADGTALTAEDLVAGLASNAGAVIAAGTCASYGGIPAATNRNYDAVNARYKNNGAASVQACLTAHGVATPCVKVPSCPVQPTAFYLTVAQYLVDVAVGGSLPTFVGRLTSDLRLKKFSVAGVNVPLYEDTIHGGNCPRYTNYLAGDFAANMGDGGCMYLRGCQGPNTFAPCAVGGGLWNDFANSFCVKGGVPCTGCAQDGYPDRFSPLMTYDNSAGY